jgi:hypothetical protein
MALRLALGLALLLGVGCSETYYSAMEAIGKDKRDLLRDNVEEVRDRQKETKEQFEDALAQMRRLYGTGGGDLEKMYDRVRASYEASSRRAKQLSERIERVEKVAADLFEEWEEEIGVISDRGLRQASREKLRQTERRFATLSAAMERAERSTQPVLVKLNDQVLFLKHNLNAQAVGNLGREVKDIERSMQALMRAMSQSILEAESFIRSMPAE